MSQADISDHSPSSSLSRPLTGGQNKCKIHLTESCRLRHAASHLDWDRVESVTDWSRVTECLQCRHHSAFQRPKYKLTLSYVSNNLIVKVVRVGWSRMASKKLQKSTYIDWLRSNWLRCTALSGSAVDNSCHFRPFTVATYTVTKYRLRKRKRKKIYFLLRLLTQKSEIITL